MMIKWLLVTLWNFNLLWIRTKSIYSWYWSHFNFLFPLWISWWKSRQYRLFCNHPARSIQGTVPGTLQRWTRRTRSCRPWHSRWSPRWGRILSWLRRMDTAWSSFKENYYNRPWFQNIPDPSWLDIQSCARRLTTRELAHVEVFVNQTVENLNLCGVERSLANLIIIIREPWR